MSKSLNFCDGTFRYGVFLQEKQKRKNHDLTVTEYKVRSLWDRYDQMQDNFDRLKERQEGLLADIHTLDIEVEKRSDFLYVLDRLREVIENLLKNHYMQIISEDEKSCWMQSVK